MQNMKCGYESDLYIIVFHIVINMCLLRYNIQRQLAEQLYNTP